jgi:hypothetical protein
MAMSTEMEKTQQPQQLLTYKQLFASPGSTFAHVLMACSRLGLMLGKVLDPPMMRLWAQQLEGHQESELAYAFNRAEREISAWPAVAQIVEYVERRRFDAALAVVLSNLRKFGPEWKDIPAYKEGDRIRKYRDEVTRQIVEEVVEVGKTYPAEPAPVIQPRMQKALELFGRDGKRETGMRRLLRDHPAYWTGETERETGQHGRQADAIDKALFECWLRAGE